MSLLKIFHHLLQLPMRLKAFLNAPAATIHALLLALAAQMASVPRGFRWAAVITWMGLIFFMSSRSQSSADSGLLVLFIAWLFGFQSKEILGLNTEHLVRKSAHFGEFGILALLVWWALVRPSFSRYTMAWLCATVYAMTDEFHQAFVPRRGASPMDVAIDSLGALSVVVALAAIRRRL